MDWEVNDVVTDNFLYKKIDLAKLYGAYSEMPHCIKDNLTKKFDIRPYQENAFCNFITYFENDNLRQKPTQTLFHMATGSGKTFIMAGLVLYLYKKGYRNFLFFVSLTNIVSKTKDNFLNGTSPKYLFAEKIVIDGKEVQIHEVNSFQNTSDDCINICFSTIQGLHRSYTDIKENAISADDFSDRKIVFISDEAHHLTVDTARGKKGSDDDEKKSWEYVAKRLFRANPNNILLEFTATCRIDDPAIRNEYLDKIVYNYDLRQFRIDGYSKEVTTLRTGLPFVRSAILALIMSQYRLKLFNDMHLDIKPVILFKSKTKAESREFYSIFEKEVSSLNANVLSDILSIQEENIQRACSYFEKNNISLDLLSQEIKDSFGPGHCIQINEDSDAETNNIVVNTLEERSNPYRAIFEVNKLDEGWDVLNLFDIVRLYDTRDTKTTVAEAQLIGRGARYCPFVLKDNDDRYRRKFDRDVTNQFRVCEELFYHCHNDSKYIDELRKALIDTGVWDSTAVKRKLMLKAEFKETDLYRRGFVLTNDQEETSRENVYSLPSNLRDRIYTYSLPSHMATSSYLFIDQPAERNAREYIQMTVHEIAKKNYNTVHAALRRYSVFGFDRLHALFPHLKSMREFIEDGAYLRDVRIEMWSDDEEIPMKHCYESCVHVFGIIAENLSDVQKTYRGTEIFRRVEFRETFSDKTVNYTDIKEDGEGTSQADSHKYRLDLSDKDWHVFNDNYGTSEEKGFVCYFAKRVQHLKEKYDQVYLVRNERQLHIYSFSEGRRFEPDYILFLRKSNSVGEVDQMQIFVEPKGENLMAEDRWKENFLGEIASRWKMEPVVLLDDSRYRVVGLPFYNNNTSREFDDKFTELCKGPSVGGRNAP